MGAMPLTPDPLSYNRRITKAFESMDAVKRLGEWNFPQTAIQQLIEQRGMGGWDRITKTNRAAIEAGNLGLTADLVSGRLGSISVGRTFDLNVPVSHWDDLSYNRRITKAFESMDAVKRLGEWNFPQTAIQQLIEQRGMGGWDRITKTNRAAIEAGNLGLTADLVSGRLGSISVGRTFDLNVPVSHWDDLSYNRRITKAFESMHAVKRLGEWNFPQTAIQQLIEQRGMGGWDRITKTNRAAIEAGNLGLTADLVSGRLGSISVGRTFDLNVPVSHWDDLSYNRRITKAFESMDAVKRLGEWNFPQTAIQQLIEQRGMGGWDRITKTNRAAIEAGSLGSVDLGRLFPGFQDFVERVK